MFCDITFQKETMFNIIAFTIRSEVINYAEPIFSIIQGFIVPALR